MRRVVVCIFFLLFLVSQVISQTGEKHCYYGISFDISKNRNWGYGELIITDVEPFSPAESAGIKVNDIIMEIDGKATYLRDYETIASWLFDNPSSEVKFTIRNLNSHFKEYVLNRECVAINSVDERFLSSFFSFYDLENNRGHNFSLPLKVVPINNVDFTDYHTFGFYEDGSTLTSIDEDIKLMLKKELEKKGLTQADSDPDLWISFFYDYARNPNYTGKVDQLKKDKGALRFNTRTSEMERMPILDVYSTSKEGDKTQYMNIAKLGITFYDRKYVDVDKYTQIWECTIEDYLDDKLSLIEYTEKHIPLILMQYPYSQVKEKSDYHVSVIKHSYTGLYFDANEINKVNDVDTNSPAYAAGIRAGYVINKINGKNLDISKSQLSEGYRIFYEDSKKYRNEDSKFTSLDGYKECMFWNKEDYGSIAKLFKKDEYKTAFSYLFDHAIYVNPNYNGIVTIEAWDGMQKRIFQVKPVTRKSVSIKVD